METPKRDHRWPTSRWRVAFHVAAWAGLSLTSYSLFLYLTEPLRVYAHVPRSATQWLAAAALLALGYPCAAWVTKRSGWPLIWIASAAGLVFLLLPEQRRAGFAAQWVSCANHSGQWWLRLDRYIEEALQRDPRSCFPSSRSIDGLLTAMIQGGYMGPAIPSENPLEQPEVDRWGFYCPGRGRSTQSDTGYVYVGGGLPMKRVMEKEALIALCAAGCHPWPEDHEHAFVGGAAVFQSVERRCCNGPEMMRLIERALQQAESGEVPYSPAAVLLLERELAARRKLRAGT